MKKFVVLLAVVAMTCLTAVAYAADVTVGGGVYVRSRDFSGLDQTKEASGKTRDTQEKIQIDVNAKAGDVKGKISIWNDFESWGTERAAEPVGGTQAGSLETEQGQGTKDTTVGSSRLGVREAWVSFNLPGIPVNVTAGHQLLSLGNGWFFRNMHFGSDAWVIANQTGNNTAAFVNVKVAEGTLGRADDVDAYVLLDVFKLDDANTLGVDLTYIKDRAGAFGGAGTNADLENLSLNYNGKLGPVALKAQFDQQFGKIKNTGGAEPKFKGRELIIQGNMALDPVTVNFTLAGGTGNKSGDNDINGFVNFLDIDPHYTFLYEYKVNTAALGVDTAGNPKGRKNTGFANTEVIGVGATFAATKSLNVGADVWYLRAADKVAINDRSATAEESNDIGTEIDVKADWKISDNLSWNWVAGYFMPGKAYDVAGKSAENTTGIQGILAYKF